ncbi:hypothetical protein JCM9279_002590 [Rhodotorula babjevae]
MTSKVCEHPVVQLATALTPYPLVQVLISSTSTQDHHEPSQLLRLPEELIDRIFKLANEDDSIPMFKEREVVDLFSPTPARRRARETAAQPICRRLYPIQRQNLYRTVRISTYSAFALFCGTVQASPGASDLVVELRLRFGEVLNLRPGLEVYDDPDWEEEDDPRDDRDIPDEDKVVRPLDFSILLARLPNLEILDFALPSTSLLDVVLYKEVTPSLLYGLKTLKVIAASLNAPDDRGQDAWVRQLAQYQSLEELSLERYDAMYLFPRLETPMPFLSSITKLTIPRHGQDWFDGPILRDLFPHLVDLDLTGADIEPDFRLILEGAPDGLRRLRLRPAVVSTFHPGADSPSNLDGILPRFKHLEHLGLGHSLFTPDGLLPYLRSLPSLRSLTFEPCAPATDTFLLSLLAGPSRLAHLRLLTLDHLYAQHGPTVASRGGRLPPDMHHVVDPPMYDGWAPPNAVPGCSAPGIVAAVEAGRAHGVCVRGTALGVVGWEEAHEEERTNAMALWGEDAAREWREECERQQARYEMGRLGFAEGVAWAL